MNTVGITLNTFEEYSINIFGLLDLTKTILFSAYIKDDFNRAIAELIITIFSFASHTEQTQHLTTLLCNYLRTNLHRLLQANQN